MATKKKDKKQVIEEAAKKLLTLMGTKAEPEVSEDEVNQAFIVDIKTDEETGLLIGRRGETLSSVQTILSLLVRQELGDWERIVVNVGDWREKEEERLKSLAEVAAQRAKETGEAQPLYNLTASQRRVVHLFLSEDADVVTESLGEDAERYLVVKPKGK